MPYLHGQPFKYELRAEIHQLSTDLWNERKEHRQTRAALYYARAQIEELKAKIQRIELKAQEVLAEAGQDVESNVKERFVQSWRKRFAV
jgi:transcriptional regulator of aromatic amino acid metabolism